MSISVLGMEMARQERYAAAERERVASSGIDTLGVKIGTNSLFKENGKVSVRHRNWRRICNSVLREANHGQDIFVVSSGAVAAGRFVSGEVVSKESAVDTLQKQSLASEGQDQLMARYRKRLGRVGQVLVTNMDLAGWRAADEFADVMGRNMDRGVISIVNENDSVAHEEIEYGDNDWLMAMAATSLSLDLGAFGQVGVVYLTDKVGLLEDKDRDDSRIAVVRNIDHVRQFVDDEANGHSTGGMGSKLNAIKHLGANGVKVWIGSAFEADSIQRIMQGETGTYFVPELEM